MRTLKFLLRKEFKQIFRNKALLPMIFMMPVIQLLVMPLAADYEVRNINIAVVDHDHSAMTQNLISKITSSGYFRLAGFGESYQAAFELIEQDKADLILEIPAGFEKDLVREGHQSLFVAVNAINGIKANLGGAYLSRIVAGFNSEVRMKLVGPGQGPVARAIEVIPYFWFNQLMNYRSFMVPGIMVVLITMVGVYMCSLNIVKEKEIGTIEQINVTPISKIYFILGKLIPFLIIGIFIFTISLFVVARGAYGIVPRGSILLLYGYLFIYLIAVLGIGLLISTYSDTQQQAMSVAFFFMMIFILMSGLFTSVESMPEWARVIAGCNPVTYFIEVMRMVVLKGSGLRDIQRHIAVMAGFALFFNTWAVLNYKKTS